MGNIVSEILYSDMSIDLRSTGSWLFFLNFRLVAISNFVRDIQWRHNDHDGVSNHQPRGCLLDRLFRRRSKKTSKLRVTGLCVGKSPGPHKGPVTRKMFPFDDVIMKINPAMHTVALSILQVDGSYQPETTINLFMYSKSQLYYLLIMTSSIGNILVLLALCVGNSPVNGEFPFTKARDAELWLFLWSAPESTVE